MRRWLLLLALCVVACDETPVVPPDLAVSEQAGEPREEIRSLACEHPSICAKCGMTLKMKFECSLSFWRNCPGHQDAKVRVTPVEVRYQSGRVERIQREMVVERIGACR